jgi:hypothetical protein
MSASSRSRRALAASSVRTDLDAPCAEHGDLDGEEHAVAGLSVFEHAEDVGPGNAVELHALVKLPEDGHHLVDGVHRSQPGRRGSVAQPVHTSC